MISYHENPCQTICITNFIVTVSFENTEKLRLVKILERLEISHLPNALYISFKTLCEPWKTQRLSEAGQVTKMGSDPEMKACMPCQRQKGTQGFLFFLQDRYFSHLHMRRQNIHRHISPGVTTLKALYQGHSLKHHF